MYWQESLLLPAVRFLLKNNGDIPKATSFINLRYNIVSLLINIYFTYFQQILITHFKQMLFLVVETVFFYVYLP